MARKFNLQPWRSKRREEQRKRFTIISTIVGLATLGLWFGYYMMKQSYLEDQTAAIATLEDGIKSLNVAKKEIEKIKVLNEEVTRQIKVIQDLQDQRDLTVKIFNYIALNTPDSVFIDAISYSKNLLTISGTVENESGVSSFIRKLQDFPNFLEITVKDIIQAKDNFRYKVSADTSVRTFTLMINVGSPKTENKEN